MILSVTQTVKLSDKQFTAFMIVFGIVSAFLFLIWLQGVFKDK